MTAQKWMKWLSVIALVLASVEVLDSLYNLFATSGNWFLEARSITILCLAIIAVLISFSKKK